MEGASNFTPWKVRVSLILMDNGIWEFSNTKFTMPVDVAKLAIYNQKDVISRRIIFDAVKDHVIPHLSENKTTREMWEALMKLYQSDNTSKKMMPREKLKNAKMTISNTVTSYLTKITQVCDDLKIVRAVVEEDEMVRTTLNGFTNIWTSFMKGTFSQEHPPNWDKLWDDFSEEDIQEESLGGPYKGDDENLSHNSQERQGHAKKDTSGEATS